MDMDMDKETDMDTLHMDTLHMDRCRAFRNKFIRLLAASGKFGNSLNVLIKAVS
jgi:hypothetical protein